MVNPALLRPAQQTYPANFVQGYTGYPQNNNGSQFSNFRRQ